jgi:uncharacterized delta-60 repeat protein
MNHFKLRTKTLMSIILPTLCISHLAYALPGDPDLDFGQGGLVRGNSPLYAISHANDVVIQTDGKIVVAGRAQLAGRSGGVILLRRFFGGNGDPDNGFGFDNISGSATFGGVVLADFGLGDSVANAVKVQADGKVVVAGVAGISPSTVFAIARFTANGRLDTTFGIDGRVTVAFGAAAGAADLAIQSEGQIVVAGSADGDFALARFNPNGSLDLSFGDRGKVRTVFGGSASASAVAIQSNGRIVVAGVAGIFPSTFIVIARYLPDGNLDSGFNNGEPVREAFGSSAFAADLAIQSDGKIVVAGGVEPLTADGNGDFAVARYNSDGTLDPKFGTSGRVRTSFDAGDPQAVDDRAFSVAIQADGKILAAGLTGGSFDRQTALFRYNKNGTLDTTFSGDGKLKTESIGGSALAIKNNNGRIVMTVDPNDQKSPFFENMGLISFHAYECNGKNATIVGTDGPDVINGTTGDDVILGLGGDDTIHGGGGNDTICGGDGNDSLFGDEGNDTLIGGAGSDTLDGGIGTDIAIDSDTFTVIRNCETINTGKSGISGAWKDIKLECNGSDQNLSCKLKGTIAVFNPKTETTAVPSVAGFYLSSDEIWDENDTFLEFADIPVLTGGEAKDVKFNVELDEGQDASGQFVIAVLDFFNAVPEANEENNVVVSPRVP